MDFSNFPTCQVLGFVDGHLDLLLGNMRVLLDRVSAAAQLVSTAHSDIQEILLRPGVEWVASTRGSESGNEPGNGDIVSMLQDMRSTSGQNFQELGRRLDRVDTRLDSMDRRIKSLEGTGEPVPAPTGESADLVSRGTKTNVPESRSDNRREPLQSHLVPAGSSHARSAYGTDQPPGALCADSLLSLVRGPPAVKGSANSPAELNRGAEAHLNRSYSNHLMVPRWSLAHLPLRLPCLFAGESDGEGTVAYAFRMPKDPESPYFVEPGRVPPGTRRSSEWLEAWTMSRRHAAITFSETGVPRVEVFDSEEDLMDAGSIYVWTGNRVYLEAAGFLSMYESSLREIGHANLVAETDDESPIGDEPTSPPSVADGPLHVPVNAQQIRAPLGGSPQGDIGAPRTQSERPTVSTDPGFSAGRPIVLPDEAESCPGMIRSVLGDQVAGVDTRTALVETPAEEAQSSDDGFPSLVHT